MLGGRVHPLPTLTSQHSGPRLGEYSNRCVGVYMYVCVCMCVCMHAGERVYVRACVRVCVHGSMCVRVLMWSSAKRSVVMFTFCRRGIH